MKKKTHEEYVEELKIKNPIVEVVGKYIDSKTKIAHHCLIHDIYWETTPDSVLHGSGCEKCHVEKSSASRTKTTKQYIAEVKKANPNIVVLESYVNAKTPILHKCTIHNVEWKAYPDNILRGCGCYKCGNEKIGDKNRKDYEQYVEELKAKNPNVIVIDSYINALTPILHRCLIDGCEWYATPANLLYGYGCPKCQESKGEKAIAQWLNNNGIGYVRQKTFDNCCDKRPLLFDFYLPKYNVAIEYDGKQHYEPTEHFGGKDAFAIRQKHDKIKNIYCKENNIKLIRISYLQDVNEELNNFLFI